MFPQTPACPLDASLARVAQCLEGLTVEDLKEQQPKVDKNGFHL